MTLCLAVLVGILKTHWQLTYDTAAAVCSEPFELQTVFVWFSLPVCPLCTHINARRRDGVNTKLHTRAENKCKLVLLPFSAVTTVSESEHKPTSQSLLLQPNTGPPLEGFSVPDGTLCDNYLLDSESEGG